LIYLIVFLTMKTVVIPLLYFDWLDCSETLNYRLDIVWLSLQKKPGLS